MSRARVYVWCELVCDECSDTVCGQFVSGGRIPVQAMRREAESFGWVFKGKSALCSERCRAIRRAAGGEA